MTSWSFNAGWQAEIAAFDFTLGLIMVTAIRRGFARALLLPLLVLSTLLGLNHVVASMQHGELGNWIGTVANAFGVAIVVWALLAGRTHDTVRRSDRD